MFFLLFLSKLIDRINEKIGNAVGWLLLAAVLICSGNALIRYAFNISSNAWLEIQWYLFAAVILLASADTLRSNGHVRIDVLTSHLSKRSQAWIDLFGFLFFLLPIASIILYFAVPYALVSFRSGEWSSNAGGLIVWPAKALIPAGFFLLVLQGVSELIKRIAYLKGLIDESTFESSHGASSGAIETPQTAGAETH